MLFIRVTAGIMRSLRVFHTLKTELIHHEQFETRYDAKQIIFEYIEVFYNRERIHFANDYLSPVDYEIQQKTV
jgi:transposase InsO family protein